MRYVIIGNSAAGVSAAESIRQLDKNGSIDILSDEPYSMYARCLTSYYLAGKLPESKIFFHSADFYSRLNISLRLSHKAVKIDRLNGYVITEAGASYGYDKLLIASGASPVKPAIPGSEFQGVFTLRTLDDAKNIRNRAQQGQKAVMIGGGFVALKAAYALRQAGLAVSCIISSGNVLSQMLDQDAADMVRSNLAAHGVEFRFNSDVTEVLGHDGVVSAVRLTDGGELPADLVIMGKGVKPNTSFLAGSGVTMDQGILINEFMETNVTGIYAAGDVAQGFDLISGKHKINALWPNAIEQGKAAGRNMAGCPTRLTGTIAMNSADFYGVSTIAVGAAKASGEGYEVVKLRPKPGIYRRLVFKEDRLVGCILVGEPAKTGVLTELIRQQTPLGEYKAELRQGRFRQRALW